MSDHSLLSVAHCSGQKVFLMSFPEIQGWFSFPDVYDQAIAEARPGDWMVELGVWMGASLCYLGDEARISGKNLKIFGVDDGLGVVRPLRETTPPADVYLPCLKNLALYDLLDRVHLLHLDSTQAAELFTVGTVQFVFIDTDHSLETTRREIKAWRSKVRPGGMLAGHDYNRPPVQQAVHELLSGVEIKGDCWLYRCD